MCAHSDPQTRSAGSRTDAVLTWLGGGRPGEPGQRSNAVTGIVLLVATLAWLIATLAVAASTTWPVLAIVPFTLVFGLLVGAVMRAIAGGPSRGRGDLIGRSAVAVAVGIVVGELAALVLFASSIDRLLERQATHQAESSPAVTAATAELGRARDARSALDTAVEQARTRRDETLVIARCEFNPSPDCPETHITGVPGDGPETQTADDLLAGAQGEFDAALAARDSQAPALDARIADDEQALAQARAGAAAAADRGFAARWVAMNDYTLGNVSALLLRLLTDAFWALLMLLPLVVKRWRSETSRDRTAAAGNEQERAELAADTAIAVKRAEVRAATEIMWAEQQLANARLTAEAQLEIDREQQRRRVAEVLDASAPTVSRRRPLEGILDRETDPDDDMYLPIAAAAAAAVAASHPLPALPAVAESAKEDTADMLPTPFNPAPAPAPTPEPAPVPSDDQPRSTPLIPDVTKAIPEVTRAAARWVRPHVPPFVTNVIDAGTQPLRTVRQVIDEVEEISFSFKRTHKVTVEDEVPVHTSPQPEPAAAAPDAPATHWVEYSVPDPYAAYPAYAPGYGAEHLPWGATPPSPALAAGEYPAELPAWEGQQELPGPYGPPQLPPAQ